MHHATAITPTHSLSVLAISATVAFFSMPAHAQEEDASSQFGESVDLIERAAAWHSALPGARVVIATSIVSKDTQITAPPTRGAFGFLRETDTQPARMRSECWGGPEGALDLISDGSTLFVGDPVHRTYRTCPAPTTVGAYLQEDQTAMLLGVGPGMLMSWLIDNGADFEAKSEPRRTLVDDRAAFAIEGNAPSPIGDVPVEFCFAAGEIPMLLQAKLPMPDGSVVAINFSEWEPHIHEQPFFSSAFHLKARPNWSYNEQTGNFGFGNSATRNDLPTRALIGNTAPKIQTLGSETLLDIAATNPNQVRILLFWSNDEAVGRETLKAVQEMAPALQACDAQIYAIQLGEGIASAGANGSITHLKGDSNAIFSTWRLSGVPTMAVIDPSGVVRAIQVGYPGKDALAHRLIGAAKKLDPTYATVTE